MPKWNLKIAILIELALVMFFTAAESCNVTHHSTGPRRSGTIASFMYPKPYPAGSNCEYHFFNTKETRLTLTFTEFDLREPMADSDGQCAFDFVDIVIIEGPSSPMRMLGRKCGNIPPQQMSTAASHVIVYFKSRSTVNDQNTGFRAEFSFSNDSALLTPSQLEGAEDSICGVTRLRGTGGVLTAPTLQNSRELQAKQRQILLGAGMINCTWTIRITEGDQILINFMSLNLGPSEVVCRDSYLLMYNSVSDFEKTGSLEKICGRLSLFPGKTKEYVSTGPWLTIRYIYKLPKIIQTATTQLETIPTASSASSMAEYDSTLAPTMASALSYEPNFRLVWTAIWNLKAGEECPGFECTGRQSCLDAGKVVCHKTPRYCVHPTLRCDGIPHCGPNDTSDEENCQLPLILSGVAAGVGVLLTLVAAIAIIVWRIRMPKQKRSKAKPVGKPLKAGVPPNLGRMFEHLAEKKQSIAEYEAVITNQQLVNTRSILASLSAQENSINSKTAADYSSTTSNNTCLPVHQNSRPVALKPSIVVNRQAGLVSVRFAAATPPGATPIAEESSPIPPQPIIPPPTIQISTNHNHISEDPSLPLLASPCATVELNDIMATKSGPPTPPQINNISASISIHENPLDELLFNKVLKAANITSPTTSMPKNPLSEEESGSVYFPPPPTNEEIVAVTMGPTPPIAITPPSLLNQNFASTTRPGLPALQRHRVQSSSSSDAEAELAAHGRAVRRHHHHHRSREHRSPSKHNQNASATIATSVPKDVIPHSTAVTNDEKIMAGLEAKAIAKLLRDKPTNSPGEHRSHHHHHHHHHHHSSSRSPSKSPKKTRKPKETSCYQPVNPETGPPPLPPTVAVSSTSDFQWELRAPGGAFKSYVAGAETTTAAATLPHFYSNIREVVRPDFLSPDSLANNSPKKIGHRSQRHEQQIATQINRITVPSDINTKNSSDVPRTSRHKSKSRQPHHQDSSETKEPPPSLQTTV